MNTEVIALYRACNNACRFCAASESLDRQPVPGGQVRAQIDQARAAGANLVVFTGGEPTLSPHLIRAITYARASGLRVGLTTHGRMMSDPERFGRIHAAGLQVAHVSLHGSTASVHNALVGGDPIAFKQTMAGLEACAKVLHTTLRTVLTSTNVHQIPEIIAIAARLGTAFDLRALEPTGQAAAHPELRLDVDSALAAWRVAHATCHELGVPFHHHGFAPAPRGATGTPRTLDAVTVAQLCAGLPDGHARAGLHPGSADLSPLLAYYRCDAAELPRVMALDGLALHSDAAEHPPVLSPDDRVHVWADPMASALHLRTTLPGLAGALDATLHTPFRAPFDPNSLAIAAPPHQGAVSRLWRRREEAPWSPSHADDLPELRRAHLASVDWSNATCVIVPGFTSAATLRPALPERCRLIIVDDGQLSGFDGQWHPGDVVISPNPRAVRLYLVSGIPLTSVLWHPVALVPSQLPSASSQGAEVVYAPQRPGTYEGTEDDWLVDAATSIATASAATLPPLSSSDARAPILHALAVVLGTPATPSELPADPSVPTVQHLAHTLRAPRPAHGAHHHGAHGWWPWPV